MVSWRFHPVFGPLLTFQPGPYVKESAMLAPDLSADVKPTSLLRWSQARPRVFGKNSASSLPVLASPSLPVRIAVIGNHLPRQCGIATFTTDLCDAIAVEYGAAGVLVVAVNDPQSRYSYPPRVRFELTEDDLSSYQAAAKNASIKDERSFPTSIRMEPKENLSKRIGTPPARSRALFRCDDGKGRPALLDVLAAAMRAHDLALLVVDER